MLGEVEALKKNKMQSLMSSEQIPVWGWGGGGGVVPVGSNPETRNLDCGLTNAIPLVSFP